MAQTALKKTAQRDGPTINRAAMVAGEEIGNWLDEPEEPSLPVTRSSLRGVESVGRASVLVSVVEPVIERLMSGPLKSQFLLLADWFESATGGKAHTVSVETPVGDVRFDVIEWIETPGFVKLVVNRDTMPFEPKPMAVMRLKRNGEVLSVTCASPLTPMFGALPFAEFLLLVGELPTYAAPMEKNARVTPGVTPSVVSGKPSDDFDNEEPVVRGEKSASIKDLLPTEDFDLPRETF